MGESRDESLYTLNIDLRFEMKNNRNINTEIFPSPINEN